MPWEIEGISKCFCQWFTILKPTNCLPEFLIDIGGKKVNNFFVKESLKKVTLVLPADH